MRRVHPLDAFRDRVLVRVRPDLAARLNWRKEQALRMVVEEFVGVGDTVVDIGAHVGVHAYRYARLVGPWGRVHAFEAHPAYARHLTRFARMPQGRLHMVALSDHEGEGELRIPVVCGQAVDAMATLDPGEGDMTPPGPTVRVPVRRLDDALPVDARPSFMKCDVEGHERAVLRGARRTLEHSHPALLVEIEQRHQQQDISGTFDLVRDMGYRGFALRADRLILLEQFDVERDQLRLLPAEGAAPPPGYVRDFVFLPHERRLPLALADRLDGPRP